jgi:Flp pilus assembly protein TadG
MAESCTTLEIYFGRRMREMEARIPASIRIIRCRPLSRLRRGTGRRRKQDGGIAVIFAVALTALLGICGLALDLSMVYNRKVEMQNIADAAALGAARKLNGSASGISDAVTAAASAATSLTYQYGRSTANWSASAIKFSTSPDRDGDWVDAGTAAATPSRMLYVKVDPGQLDGAVNVRTVFMSVLSPAFATASASSDAIAGRTTIEVAPLALCAMSQNAATQRINSASYVELVEYGFRRGVSYDLMNLNPAAGPAANFVVNPLAPPGTPGSPADLLPSTVGPYVCTGTLGIPRLAGDAISVAQPFPLGSLYKQLNSRFDQYEDGLCSFNAAPPDINIKSYVYTSMPSILPWMNMAPNGQTAAFSSTGGKRQTIADLPPPGGTAAQYGPVWSYAKAVPFSAYAPGVPEPSPNGYSPFTTGSWSALYGGQTARATYPNGTPYKALGGVNFSAPSAAHKPGLKGRRVLNVPLLSCAVPPGGSANVIAIGKFFMTVPATATSLSAEFAGAVPPEGVAGSVGLFP